MPVKGGFQYTIKDMQELARSRGGECLSEFFAGVKKRHHWKCNCGNMWWTTPHTLLSRKSSWCPKCSSKRAGRIMSASIGDMQKLAASRGGECLSEAYINSKSPLQWRHTVCGTEWWAKPNYITTGSWCPHCGGSQKLDIQQMHELAEARGGKCLSLEYTNIGTKLLWECSFGHHWLARPHDIKHKSSWCPHCRHKSEQECRANFEALTGKSFPKCRPRWLEGLELDGYCDELGIAFEYNGEQHYQVVPEWHRNGGDDLEAQKARDAKKTRLCEKNWVVLIVIPFGVKDRELFIGRELADILG